MSIAKEILRQLGGNRFIAMTGAKNFLDHGNALSFKIGRNSSRANKVKVTLDPDDTYTVEFGRFQKLEYKTLETKSGVYNDMLQSIFTAYTGLDTHL